MSWLLRFFYCCISFTAIVTFSENVPARGFGKRESGTNFLEHFHWFLNVKASVSITAHDAMACALECLRHSFCLSFNFAVSPGRHDCELLREDKYTFSDRFEPSQFYHHYSMAVGKHNIRVVQQNDENLNAVLSSLSLKSSTEHNPQTHPRKLIQHKNIRKYMM